MNAGERVRVIADDADGAFTGKHGTVVGQVVGTEIIKVRLHGAGIEWPVFFMGAQLERVPAG